MFFVAVVVAKRRHSGVCYKTLLQRNQDFGISRISGWNIYLD
jgi:hypothetical protein